MQLKLHVRPESWEVHLYYTKLGVRIFGKGEIRSMYRGGCYEKAKKIVKEVFFVGGNKFERQKVKFFFCLLGDGK